MHAHCIVLWEGPGYEDGENVLVSKKKTYTEQVYDAMHAAKKDVIHAEHHIL